MESSSLSSSLVPEDGWFVAIMLARKPCFFLEEEDGKRRSLGRRGWRERWRGGGWGAEEVGRRGWWREKRLGDEEWSGLWAHVYCFWLHQGVMTPNKGGRGEGEAIKITRQQ